MAAMLCEQKGPINVGPILNGGVVVFFNSPKSTTENP